MEFWPPLSYKNRESEWNEGDEDHGNDDEEPLDGEHDVDMRVGIEGSYSRVDVFGESIFLEEKP